MSEIVARLAAETGIRFVRKRFQELETLLATASMEERRHIYGGILGELTSSAQADRCL
jgi:hypothetical protein